MSVTHTKNRYNRIQSSLIANLRNKKQLEEKTTKSNYKTLKAILSKKIPLQIVYLHFHVIIYMKMKMEGY